MSLVQRYITLAEVVQRYPVLYAEKRKELNEEISEEDAWSLVSTEMGWSVVKCQKTWRYLRERFARESRLHSEKKPGLKRDKWEIYDSLGYLLPHIKRRRYDKRFLMGRHGVADCEERDSDVYYSVKYENMDTPNDAEMPSTSSDDRKYQNILPIIESSMDRSSDGGTPIPQMLDVSGKDEDFLYSESIAMCLKRMTSQQKALAKFKIQEILYKVELGLEL